jgi:protein SCO1/2
MKWIYKVSISALFVLLLGSSLPLFAVAQAPTPDPKSGAGFDQKLNDTIPLDLNFKDEAGKEVRLTDYFDGKPVVLQLAYYSCPMLCSVVSTALAKIVPMTGLDLESDYEIITVSIDPRDKPQIASEKKVAVLKDYGIENQSDHWHFLTGEQAEITELARSVGFRYYFDAEQDQYVHPAGLMILTPSGRISRYIYGIEFPPKDLRLGLVEASSNHVGTPVDQFLLLCYGYDPVTGRYSFLITKVIKYAAVGFASLMGLALLLLVRNDRSRKKLDYRSGKENTI